VSKKKKETQPKKINKKMEMKNLRLEDRFIKVLNGQDAAIYIADMDTYEILFINKYGRDRWGDIEGKICWKELQTGQTGPCEFCTNEYLVDANGKPSGIYRWEFRNTIDNRWYDCRDQAIEWIDGRIVRIETATDITERKQMEEGLAEHLSNLENLVNIRNEEHKELISLFDLTIDMLCTADINGCFRSINKAWQTTLGYTEEELLSKPYIDFVHPDDVALTIAEGNKLSQGQTTIYFENRYRCKDGSYKWLAWTSSPNPETGITFAVCRDITEKKQMETSLQAAYDGLEKKVEERTAELLEANRRLALEVMERKLAEESIKEQQVNLDAILSSIEEGILAVHNEKDILYTNDRFARMWRIPDEVIASGDDDKLLDYVMDQLDDPDSFISKVRALYASTEVDEDVLELKDDRVFERYSKPLMVEDNIVGRLWLFRDITAFRLAEKERQAMEAQIQHIQNLESLGLLAGGIAHDFNNLLLSIQGKTSVMLQGLNKEHFFHEQLKGIEELIQSGSEVTSQLLGFAREGKLEVKAIDLNLVVKNTSKMFASTKKDIKIHRKYQKNVWAVEVDKNQIDQVLLNLFVNASQAMPKGGDIYIETENVTLDEVYVKSHLVEPGKFVKISFTDTGTGIDEDALQKIFDPFFTTKDVDKGTGLGLASAYGIIKNHNGIINAYSEKGVGSTFNIYLPVTDNKITNDIKPPDDIKKGTETILFIDDEQRIRDAGKEMLEILGYKVLLVASGKEAIKTYRKKSKMIDLVILDMILPEMDGSEIYDRLKNINPNVKVILSSGFTQNGQAAEILKKGCNDFIQKPFTLKQISQKISEILS